MFIDFSTDNILIQKDQIELWSNYYAWAFRQYGRTHKVFFDILDRMTRCLSQYQSLYNEPALVRAWVMYSEFLKKPIDAYRWMKEKKIGNKSYIFYSEYAKIVEKLTRDFKKVDKIYRHGLKEMPDQRYMKRLQTKYDSFGDRMQGRIDEIMPFEKSNSNNKESAKRK